MILKRKILLSLIIAVGLIASGIALQSNVNINQVEANYSIQDGQEAGEWIITFNAEEDTDIDFVLDTEFQDALEFHKVERFEGDWIELEEEITGNNPSFNWEEEGVGRIRFEISEFDEYSGTLQTDDSEEINVESQASIEQRSDRLRLGDMTIPFRLCGFAEDFWLCSPAEDQPGYEGEIMDLEAGEETERTLELPSDSEIEDFSFLLESTENETLLNEIEGEMFSLGNLESDNDKLEIITFEDETVRVHDVEGTVLWEYESNYDINDISVGQVKHQDDEEGIVSDEEDILVSTTNSLILLDYEEQEKEWKIEGDEYEAVGTGEITTDQVIEQEDDGEAEDLLCLGCDDKEAQFELPFEVNESKQVFYLNIGLNYIDNEQDLILEIGDQTYDLETEGLVTDNIEQLQPDNDEIDQIRDIGRTENTLEIPQDDLNANDEYLQLPIATREGVQDQEITLNLGEQEETIHSDQIEQEITVDNLNTVEELNTLTLLEDTIQYELDFDIEDETSNYVSLPINRQEGEEGEQLAVNINENTYNLDTSEIETNNIQNYGEDNENPQRGQIIDQDNTLEFDLFYNIPENIEAEKLYLRTALSKFNNPSGDLQLEIGGEEYSVSEEDIEQDSEEEYSINDGNRDGEICIECEDEEDEGLVPEFDLSAFDTDNFGETAEINMKMCQQGDGGTLELGGDLASTYTMEPDLSDCEDSGYGWASVEVDSDDLQGLMEISCDDCDSENNIKIATDASTGGEHSQVFNQTSGSTIPGSELEEDFMVNVTTDTSLDFEYVDIEVDKEVIEQDQTATFSCEDCADDEGSYRMMLDDETSGNTRVNGEELDKDSIIQVWTNSSLEHEDLQFRVDTEDLQEAEEMEIECSDCGEGYNILSDSGISQNTYRNEDLLGQEAGIEILSKPTFDEFTTIEIDERPEEVGISCEDCEEDFYLGLDSSSSLQAFENSEPVFGGSTARIWSNTSLNFDFVRTEVDSDILEENDEATIRCEDCEDGAYHLMIDENSELDSQIIENGESSQVNGGFIVRQEAFGSNLGNEVAAAQPSAELQIFNSTGDEIWESELINRANDIVIDKVDEDATGNQVIIATRDGIEIYSATGELITDYKEESGQSYWVEAIKTENIDEDTPENDIIMGTTGGDLKAINSQGEEIWSNQYEESINSIATGTILKEDENTIAAGLDNGIVKIIDFDGEEILEYPELEEISDIEIGETTDREGEELGVSNSEQIEFFNLYDLPENLEVNMDENPLLEDTGVFRGTEQLSSENIDGGTGTLNEILEECDGDMCDIDITFEADSDGQIRIKQPEILFDYNLEETLETEDQVTAWAERENIEAGTDIRYSALELAYTTTPTVPINIGRISSSDIQSALGDEENIIFNAMTISAEHTSTYIDLASENVPINLFPETTRDQEDLIWYNSEFSESPVSIETEGFEEDGNTAEKPVTIERNTQDIDTEDLSNPENIGETEFVNVTTQLSFDEELVQGDHFVEVQWRDSEEFTDITPGTAGCEEHEEIEIDGDSFYTCIEDTEGDDILDTVEIIQPTVEEEGSQTAETEYNIGGTSNFPPELTSLEITPDEDVWGEEHEVTAEFENDEEDSIETKLWVESDEEWTQEDQTIIEGNEEIAELDFTTEKEMTGSTDVKIEYVDLNEDGEQIRPPINSSTETIQINERPIEVELLDSGEDEIDRIGESNTIEARVTDQISDSTVNDGEAFCFLYISNGDLDLIDTGFTDAGNCQLDLEDLEDQDLGQNEWYVDVSGQDYYEDTETETQQINLLGNLEYEIDFEDDHAYLENEYDLPEEAEYQITNIRDLTGEERTPDEIDVDFDGTRYSSPDEIDEGFEGEIRPRSIEDTDEGEKTIEYFLEKENFNTAQENINFTVKDSFESILSSSEEVIDQSQTIDLVADFERDRGDETEEVNPENVSFDVEADGFCQDINDEGSTITCEFSPSSSLSSGIYEWSVEAEKEYNEHIEGQDEFEVSGDINADVELVEDELYRNPDSEEGTNELEYTIENVENEEGEAINDVEYRLEIEDEDSNFQEVDSGTTGTGSNEATETYQIDEEKTTGPTNFRVVVDAEENTIDEIKEIDIFGTLLAETQPTDNVYIPTTETLASEDFSTETTLGLEVESDVEDEEITEFEADFNTPQGSCGEDEGNCIFEPSSQGEAGEYEWSATVEKEYYETAETEEREFLIQDILQLAFRGGDDEIVESRFDEQASQSFALENTRGDRIDSEDFATELETEPGDLATFEDSISTLEWTTTCTNYDQGEQELTVELIEENNNELYTIYDDTEEILLQITNSLDVEILTPLDISDENAEAYTQGDNIQLETEVTGDCGENSEEFEDDILWTAEMVETEEQSTIGSGLESTWSIPDDFSGITEIESNVDGEFLEDSSDSVEIAIEDVITLNITESENNILREIDNEEEWEGEFEAAVYTGQEELASDSEIDEDWTNFEITWYIGDDEITTETTDEDGIVETDIEFPDDYNPGEEELSAELEPIDDSDLSTTIIAPQQFEQITITDESRTNIQQAPEEAFFAEEVNLEMEYQIASGEDNKDEVDPSFEWRYQRPEDNVDTGISTDKVSEWVISSSVYAEGQIIATTDNEYITFSEDSQDLTAFREANIEEWNPEENIPQNEQNEFDATIDIPGFSEEGYEVEFSLFDPEEDDDRDVVDTAEVDPETGQATINWETDMGEFDPGSYNTFLTIEDDEELYVEVGPENEKERQISIADDVEVTESFRANLEPIPGTRDEDNIHGQRYDNLPEYVVYRNEGAWQHPTELYLGANLTAPRANEEGRNLVDDAEAQFVIEHDETGEERQVATCMTNVEEPEQVDEDFFGFYGCETIWDASETEDLDVGTYSMSIQVEPPSEDWTVQEETDIQVEVRGLLEVSIEEPFTRGSENERPEYVMGENDEIPLVMQVEDEEGNEYTEDELDDVNWRIWSSRTGTRDEVDWSNHDNEGRGNVDTSIELFDPDSRRLQGNLKIFASAEKDYFEPVLNQHRRDYILTGLDTYRNAFPQWDGSEERGDVYGSSFSGYQNNYVSERILYRIPVEMREFANPGSDTIDTDDDDILNEIFQGDAYRKGTDTLARNTHSGFEFRCLNCTESDIDESQDRRSPDPRYRGEFRDFEWEDEYNERYEFEMCLDGATYLDDEDDRCVSETFRIVRDLGAGDGDCDGSTDDPVDGENVLSCPNEYGFDELPQEYWLNETAQDIEVEELDDDDPRVEQYNQFANEGHEDYEADVRWYGEHSEYEDTDAGGCKYNGETDDGDEIWEEREQCTDWTIDEEPPEFENIEIDTGYYRADTQEPIQEFEVEVDYPTQDENNFDYIIDGDINRVGEDDTDDSEYPIVYEFDVDPSEYGGGDIEVIMEADTEEGETADETAEIIEDQNEIIIDEINVDDPISEEEPDGELDIVLDLSDVTIDGEGVERLEIDGEEATGVNPTFDQDDESYTIENVDFEAQDDTVSAQIFHKSGLESEETESEEFRFNEHDPVINTFEIDESNGEWFKEGDRITFTIEIDDDDNELDFAELRNPDRNQICESDLDDLEDEEGNTISCSHDIETSDTGENLEFELEAFDTADRDTEDTVQLQIDNDEPNIDNIELDPEDGIIGPDDSVTIEAEISDQEGNIDETWVEDNGGNELCSDSDFSGTDDVYECTIDDLDGSTTLVVHAEDLAGNTNEEDAEPDVVVAENNPEIVIERPEEGELVNGQVIFEAEVTDEDELLDSETVELELDGGDTITRDMSGPDGEGGEFTYTVDTEDLSDGDYTVTVSAEDEAGNDASETLTEDIEIDNTKPQIDIDSIDDIVTGDEVFEVTIEDENLDENTLTYDIDGATGSVSGDLEGSEPDFDTGSIDTTQLGEGDATITIEAEDEAGNEEEETSSSFNVNNEPPEIDITSPTGDDNEFFNDEIDVETNIEDLAGNEDESSYVARIEGETVEDSNPTIDGTSVDFNLDVSNLDTGEYTLEVEADDTENTGPTEETVTVNIDTDTPNIGEVSLENEEDEVVEGESEVTVEVDANVEEAASSDIEEISVSFPGGGQTELSLDSGDERDGTWTGSLDAPDEEGQHDLEVDIMDQAGNEDEETEENLIEVDNTPPTVTDFGSDAQETEDGEAIVQTGEEFELTVEATDDNENLEEVRIEDESETVLDEKFAEDLAGQAGGTYTITVTPEDLGLDGGSNELTAVGEDLAENTGEDEYNIRLEDDDPVIEDISVDDDVVQSGTAITVTAEITEEYLETVEFEHDGETISVSENIEEGEDGTQTFTTDINAVGDHEDEITVEVYAEDLAGNNDDDSTTYRINDEAPTILEELEVEGSEEIISRSDENLEFQLEATDDFEIDRVELHGPSQDLTMNSDGQNYDLTTEAEDLGCDTGVDYEDCEIDAKIYDNAENMEETRAVTVTIDDVPPSVSNFEVSEDIVQTDTEIDFDATISDEDPDLTTEIRDSNEGLICSLENGEDYSCTNSFSSDGDYTVNVFAEDTAGNTNEDEEIEIVVTDEAPNIGEINDDARQNEEGTGVTRSDEEIRIDTTVEDPDDLLETVEIEGQAMTEGENNEFFIEEEPEQLGCSGPTDHEECTITITAEDEAGNDASANHQIIIDNEPAEIAEVTMEEEVLTSGSSTEVTVQLEDDEADDTVNYVEVEPSVSEDNNLTWDENNQEWNGLIELESTENTESTEQLEINSVDFAGNTDTNTNQEYILDDENPEITLLGITQNIENNEGDLITRSDEELTFDIDVTDNVDIDKIEIGEEGSEKETVAEDIAEEPIEEGEESSQEFIDITPEQLGCPINGDFDECVIEAEATDLAGNTDTSSFEIIIDDQEPSIDEIELSDSIVQPNTEVDVTVDTNEESDQRIKSLETGGDAEEISLEWNEEDENWAGTLQLDDTEGDERELEIFAEDWAGIQNEVEGNTNQETKEYTVDDTPPAVNNLVTNSSDDIERSDTELLFEVEATNQFEELEKVEVEGLEMDSEAGNIFSRETAPEEVGCTEETEPGSDGCTINATATDQAGNVGWTTYEIIIENTPPQVEEYDLEGVIEGDPFDSTLPDEELDLILETDNPLSNTTAELYAVNRTNDVIKGGPVPLNESEGDDNYEAQFATQDLGVTSSIVDFTVNITDQAGNMAEDIYTLDLDTVPPSIEEVHVNNTQPETTRDTVEITANISHPFNIKEGIEGAYINITAQDNDSFEEQINLENVEAERESDSINSGNFTAEFVPPETDTYNVRVFAEDEFDEPDDVGFESVFTSIGDTDLQLSMTPEFTQFEEIDIDNPAQYELETVLENVGEATAYDILLQPSNIVTGIESNITDKDCGEIRPGERCTAVSQINVTANAGDGLKTLSSNAFWNNPDQTPGSAAQSATTNIEPNPILEVTSDTHEEELVRGETGELNIELLNRGNIQLEDIETSISQTGGVGLINDDFNAEEIEILEIGEQINTTIELTDNLEDKGEYPTTFEFDATDSDENCDEDSCIKEAETNITLFHEVSVALEQEDKVEDDAVYREEDKEINIMAEIEDDQGEAVEDYEVHYIVDQEAPEIENEKISETLDTDSEGAISENINLREDGFQPGEYIIRTGIEENESRFYKTDQEQDNIVLEVRDELNVERELISDSTLWYTDDDDPIEIEYTVTDMQGEPVQGAEVQLRSNASDDAEEIQDVEDENINSTCPTDNQGECSIEYRPDASSQGSAQIESVIEKNEYYNQSPVELENDIEIEGDFSTIITTPEDEDNLIRGREYDLEAAVLDDRGEQLDEDEIDSIEWEITDSDGEAVDSFTSENNNETTWNIPNEKSTEEYTIGIEVESTDSDSDDDQPPATDEITVSVFEPATIENFNVDPTTTERKDSEIEVDFDVTDSNGDSISDYEFCRLFVEGEEKDITSSNGQCDLVWETDENDSVGTNNLLADITEFRTEDTWYLPDPEGTTEQEEDIVLEEDINLTVLQPQKDIYRFNEIPLEANTTDAFDRQIETDVEWILRDADEVLEEESNESIWDAGEATLGEDTLDITAEKEDFNTREKQRTLNIFGKAQHEFELENEYTIGDQIDIEINVSDVDTEEDVENQPVRLYKNDELWDNEDVVSEDGIVRTNDEGIAEVNWDTDEQDSELGDYNITTELMNSTDNYYNETTGNQTQRLFLGGELETEIEEITEDQIYRDQFNEPLETDIELKTTLENSDDPIEEANNTVIIDNQEVGYCQTDENGECTFTWNPSENTSIGGLEGVINTTSANFFPSQSEEFTIDVKTAAEPELEHPNEVEYDFSTEDGVPINATVLESFTEQPIERYNFTLGWGQREPLYFSSLDEEDWNTETPEQVNTTESGLLINDTTITKTPQTDEGVLEEVDILEILTTKEDDSIEWNATVRTESEEEYEISTNKTQKEKRLDNETIEELEISTDGEITILDVELATLELDNRRELMYSELLGEEAGVDAKGNFNETEIQETLAEDREDSSEEPLGWYTDFDQTHSNAEISLQEGIFGTPGLEINMTEVPENESTTIVREYEGSDIDPGYGNEFELLEFWMNSELDIQMEIIGDTCSQTYNVESEEWEPAQTNITDYGTDCGETVERIEFEIENTKGEELENNITLDQFRRYSSSDTTQEAVKELSWLPPGEGLYSLKLEIEDEEYYNTTEQLDIGNIEITSDGAGLAPDAEDEDEIPEDEGELESIEIVQTPQNQTLGANTYGNIEGLVIESTSTEPVNITLETSPDEEEDPEILQTPQQITLDAQDLSEILIPYETGERGNYSTKISVFESGQDEREDVLINKTVEPIETEIVDIWAENGQENITAGDELAIETELSVDDIPIEEDVEWSVSLEERECENAAQNFTGQNWNLTCEAPSIDENPLQVNLETEAEYQGVEVRDNQTLGYKDVTPPIVEDKNANNIEQGEMNEVNITAWDNDEIADIEGEVLFLNEENETEETMKTIDFENPEEGFYNAEFEIGTPEDGYIEGDYDVEANITDVNDNKRTVRVPFSVHPFVEMSGEGRAETEFSFNRPGTDQTLENFVINSPYNFDLQNRSYDIQMTAPTDVVIPENNVNEVQEHGLTFKDVEISGDIENPINIEEQSEVGEDVNFERPEDTTEFTFSSISYDADINYSSVEIALDYSDVGKSMDQIPEEDLTVYQCDSSNIEECQSNNWTELDTTINTSEQLAIADSGTSSSYIVERKETGGDEEDEEDDGSDGDDDSLGGPGPSEEDADDEEEQGLIDQLMEELGVSEEELEELIGEIAGVDDQEELEALIEEEGLEEVIGELEDEIEGTEPFQITPRIYHPVMERGESRTFYMEITNNIQEESNISLEMEGEIEEILSFQNEELTIPPESSTLVEMMAEVPSEAEIGTYSGEITATHDDFETTSSHQILVVEQGIELLQLNLQTLTQTIEPGENLIYMVEVGDSEIGTPLNATLEHYVRESETDEIIKQTNETRTVDEGSSFEKELELDDPDLGNYYVQTILRHDEQTVSASENFQVGGIFWTPFRRQAGLLILLTALITVSGWKGYQYYWNKKEEDARYVFPVDYSRLPEDEEDNYWVGKVAETEKESFIDPDDLTTHAIVSGSTGSGKSVTASVIVEEALENDVPVVVFDPTAQWTGFVKELKDSNLFEHYDRFDMDKQEDAHPYRGIIKEIDSESPDIDFEELKQPGEITVFTLDQLTTQEFDQAVRKIIDQIFDKEWEESPELEMLIVFDEVHRLLEEYGGQGGYHALEKGAREFRKWGIGLMMCSQVTADFKQAISGNIMTEIQMQTKSMDDIDRVETKYGEDFAKRISSEDVGTGMIQNSNYNDGDPWFVDFRPTYHNPHKIPDKELKKYHELSEQLSGIKEKIQKRKEQGEDIRDKKLEMQLAENKLKEGRFKMAKMYIESLEDEMNL